MAATAPLAGAGAFDPRRSSLAVAAVILALVAASIGAVLAFEAAGYPPCELCLKERWPFYAGLVLAAAAVPLSRRAPRSVARAVFAALALLFLFSAVFGGYHAGVEWGLWPGPTDCTGTLARAATPADFLHQLQSVHVVRCDAAAIRILGMSLAGWNAIVSLAIAGLAVVGAARLGRG